jgi:hypothetical protein
MDGYHLSGCYITATILLPTLPDILQLQKYKRAAYLPKANRDIRGIAAHKVYPKLLLPTIPVSSYLTFSPLSTKADGNFLWHFLPDQDRGRPLTGVLLYAVRTFLHYLSITAITRFAVR